MSNLTVADLRAANPESVRASALAWAALGDALDASYERFLEGQKRVDRSGAGSAVRAAAVKVLAQGHELSGLCAPARQIARALMTHADVVAALQPALEDVLARARSYGVVVNETTGSVSVPPELFRHDRQMFQELIREVAGDLREIMQRARDVDDETYRAVSWHIPAPGYGFGQDRDWRVDRRTVEENVIGKSAADVHMWWETLSPEQQEWILADYPELVGGANGIPAADRDQANRINLDRQLAQAREQAANWEYLAAHPSLDPRYEEPNNPYPGSDQQHRYELQQLATAWRTSANGLESVQRTLQGTPDSYLLLIDGAGDGRVSIAVGNPDYAAHTAVLVPGVGTDLQDVASDINRASILRQNADAVTPNQGNDVSVVYWLGYDPPDHWTVGWQMEPSKEGGAELPKFVDGLHLTHVSTPDAGHVTADAYHVTAIGHSYGSVVVGEAAMTGGLHVDDIVTAGSPGMHTDHASNLNIDPSHVWTGRAPDDPIRHSPELIHGLDPTSPEFGANTYVVDTTGHSAYWNANSLSLLNQAYVVTGRYDDVQLVHRSSG